MSLAIVAGNGVPIPANQELLEAFVVNPLPVPLLNQEQTNWCWAACTAMNLRFGNPINFGQITVCQVAATHLQKPCCVFPSSADCNVRRGSADILPLYARFGFHTQPVNRALLPQEVVGEINAGRPVEVGLVQFGVTGHLVLVIGASGNSPETLRFVINDPLFGHVVGIPYSILRTNYRGEGWQWRVSWVDIRLQ